jgi:transcriptional regulator with XRE-family HTH domain
MSIGKRIKELIHDLSLSQIEFAHKLDKFPQYISDIVNEKKNPGIDFINKIVDKFPQVNPEWLLYNKGQKFRNASDDVQEPDPQYLHGNSGKLEDDIIKGLEANIFYLRGKMNKLEEEKKLLQLEIEHYKKLLEKN